MLSASALAWSNTRRVQAFFERLSWRSAANQGSLASEAAVVLGCVAFSAVRLAARRTRFTKGPRAPRQPVHHAGSGRLARPLEGVGEAPVNGPTLSGSKKPSQLAEKKDGSTGTGTNGLVGGSNKKKRATLSGSSTPSAPESPLESPDAVAAAAD